MYGFCLNSRYIGTSLLQQSSKIYILKTLNLKSNIEKSVLIWYDLYKKIWSHWKELIMFEIRSENKNDYNEVYNLYLQKLKLEYMKN